MFTKFASGLLAWVALSSCPGSVDAQILMVSLDKTMYRESEDVWAYVCVINNSDTVVHVAPYITYEDEGLRFSMTDSTGKALPKLGRLIVDGFGQERLLPIEPHDSISNTLNIIYLFANVMLPHAPGYLGSLDYLSAGSYHLHVSAIDGLDTLRSNEIDFAVTKPERQDLDALALLRRGEEEYVKRERQASRATLEKLISDFPNSVYTPNAYHNLVRIASFEGDTQQLSTILSKYCEGYSDHAGARSALEVYSQTLKLDQRRVLYESLLKHLPETKVGRLSKRELQRMN